MHLHDEVCVGGGRGVAVPTRRDGDGAVGHAEPLVQRLARLVRGASHTGGAQGPKQRLVRLVRGASHTGGAQGLVGPPPHYLKTLGLPNPGTHVLKNGKTPTPEPLNLMAGPQPLCL